MTNLSEPQYDAQHIDTSERDFDREVAEQDQAMVDASGPPFDRDVDPDGLDCFSPDPKPICECCLVAIDGDALAIPYPPDIAGALICRSCSEGHSPPDGGARIRRNRAAKGEHRLSLTAEVATLRAEVERIKAARRLDGDALRSVNAMAAGFKAEVERLRAEVAKARQRAFSDVAAWLDGYADMALAARHIRCNVNDTDAPGNGSFRPICCECGSRGYVSFEIRNDAGEADDDEERCACNPWKPSK